MAETSLTQVVAANIKYWMEKRSIGTQGKLAEKAGVAQRTVGSFIEPKVRLDTTTGKEPSGTIANLAKIADALKIPAWQLMRPFSADEWKAYEAVEEAFLVLHKNIAKPKAEVKRPSIDAANAHTVKDKANERK